MLPEPPSGLDLSSLAGRWAIVATTLGFWRGKQDPFVTYEPLGDAANRWRDVLTWSPQGRPHTTRSLVGFDTPAPGAPGRFLWRGRGLLALLSSPWAFVRVDPAGEWVVTWFGRATLGVTAEGMDVYARSPSVDTAAIRRRVAEARADARFSHLGGWSFTRFTGIDRGAPLTDRG